MRALICIALLSLGIDAHAQSTTEETEGYLTAPTFPAPNPDSFNWDAEPPESVGASLEKATTYPLQFVNGEFNVRTGWNVVQSYGINSYPSYTGPVDTGPSGGLAYLAQVCINPALITICPVGGSISQTVHVGENMRLSFDWQPGRSQTGFAPNYTYIDNNIRVTIVAPQTGQILMPTFTPAAVSFGYNGRHSEVDLSAFSGIDITVYFSVASSHYYTQVGNAYSGWWSGLNAAVDNVKLIAGPASTFSGSALPGNWYNPLRSGSGWDLRKAPDGSFYAIWYAYDEARNPVWYITGQGYFGSGILDVPLYACSRTTGNGACAVNGRAQLRLRSERAGFMKFDFYGQGTPGNWDGIENFELLLGNGGNYSGHYHSNDPVDSAWGLTVLSYAGAPNQTQVMVPIYYYDASGKATWSIAAEAFVNGSAMTVNRLTGGLCPTCSGSYPTITKTPVGSIRLNFDIPNQSSLIADMELSSPAWIRSARRYYKLSN